MFCVSPENTFNIGSPVGTGIRLSWKEGAVVRAREFLDLIRHGGQVATLLWDMW